MFIFQQQLSFITSTYSIVQSQNSVQESHVRPWQCAIRKSIIYNCKVSMKSSELLGGEYWYWMALGKCFTADLYLVRMWHLYILLSPPSSEWWWESVFVEDYDENLWLLWAGFTRSDQRGTLPCAQLAGRGAEEQGKTVLTGNSAGIP